MFKQQGHIEGRSYIKSLLTAQQFLKYPASVSSYCIVRNLGGEKFSKFTVFEHLAKKFGELID